MSGIFGLIHLDGSPVPPETLAAMRQAMAHWGPEGGETWMEGCAGLGGLVSFNTPEAKNEQMPLVSPRGFILTAAARLDNRPELCAELGLDSAEARNLPDGTLILRAYETWGAETPQHLLGDWTFAAWHPTVRRLFLARDHSGNTSLYYYYDQRRFAFASARQALLALGIPRRLNEFFLASTLIAWMAHYGAQTSELDVQRLPPAHLLTLADNSIQVRQYWHLDVPELRLKCSEEYVEGFLTVYERAVRDRLRSPRPIGATLSGGLDSGSVAALAARNLAGQGARLRGYTFTPIYDVAGAVGPGWFGNEAKFARATAELAGIDFIPVEARELTPMAAIRRGLEIHAEPGHGASNLYWMLALLDLARRDGCGTLLTGQGGNATISWTGKSIPRLLCYYWKTKNWKAILQQLILPIVPPPALKLYRQAAWPRHLTWETSAISPDFVRRFDLPTKYVARMDANSDMEAWHSAEQQRRAVLQVGRAIVGSIWAEMGAAYGLEVRDPTFDKRVLEYCCSVPNREYLGPDNEDRWLIRRATQGLLPDMVRLNYRRGFQGADIVPRLRASAPEVEAALATVASSGLASQYLAVERMRQGWAKIQNESGWQVTQAAINLLTRGLMAGLYLVNLEKETAP